MTKINFPTVKFLMIAITLAAMALVTPAASADTLTLNNTACGTATGTCNYAITYSVFSGTYTGIATNGGTTTATYAYQMTFNFVNNSNATGWIQGMSLTALSGSVTGVSDVVAAPSTSMTVTATGNSSGNNGGSGCTGNTQGAVCVDISGNAGVAIGAIAPQNTQSFTVYLNDPTGAIMSGTNSWNVKANITAGSDRNTTALVALSTSGTPGPNTPTPPPVPEPASMVLFGTGLTTLAAAVKRFKK